VTGADGSYRFDGVAPGDWWVGLVPDDNDEANGPTAPPDLGMDVRTVHIEAGTDVELESTARRESSIRNRWEDLHVISVESMANEWCSLRGTVVDADGRRVSGTRAQCFAVDGAPSVGAFRRRSLYAGLEPGRHLILADDRDFRCAKLRIDARAGVRLDDVELVLERGGRIDVRNLGPRDYVDVRARLGRDVVGSTYLRIGETETFVVPSGRIQLEIRRGERYVRWKTVDLEAGETVPVTVDR
jgi:hypothetical protein